MKFVFLLIGFCTFLFACGNHKDSGQYGKPNIVIIFTDDQGYGDLGCYGNPTIHTPNLDLMAEEGTRFTQFYVAASVCTPSRSALLTGCYPKRIGLHNHVLFPYSSHGISNDELLMSEMLKGAGYVTACVGKWHLGHQHRFLPLQHGFDKYYGIPFSNDMSRKEQVKMGNKDYPWHLPLMQGNDTIELDPDQSQFTRKFTEYALDFIRDNQNKPFFLYLVHPMPHIPLYASENFKGKSRRGLYGDVIEEIDWSVGQIMNLLKDVNIYKNTLMIFTSDNGPWLSFKTHGGSAGPLRGGKGTTWEGGMREPCIMLWPEKIPAARICAQMITSMDLFPTIAAITGGDLPVHKIDGRNIQSLLTDPNIQLDNDHPFLYYSSHGIIEGFRKGPWKFLMRDSTYRLYNVEEDISEKYDLSDQFPEKVNYLRNEMIKFDHQLDIEMRPADTIQVD